MSDIVERAQNWAADAKVAHTYGVGIRVDLSTIGMVTELAAEVERLRATIDCGRALHWPSPTRNEACDCVDGLTPCPTAEALQ